MGNFNKHPHKNSRVRNLIAFSSLIMLLFCLIVGIQATQSYQAAIRQGKDNAERLTRILSDHAELTFTGIDLTLRRAVERQYFNLLFGDNLPSYMEHNFRLWVNDTPQIAALMMVDENGRVTVAAHKKGYERWMDYTQSLEETSLFHTMREANDMVFYIGPHFIKTGNNGTLIIMSRKLNKLDGSFGGMVVAAVDPAYFMQFFTSVNMGTRRYMSIALTDGTLLASGPSDVESNNALMTEHLKTPPAAAETVDTQTRTVGDSLRILSSDRLHNLPVTVSVVLSEDDFLADWRQARIKDIGFLAIFTIFGSVLSFFALTMARQITYVEESEAAAILASQAKSEFLANMSHELRTPLNAIIGFSEMMSSGYFGSLNAKQKERINDINLCGSHLLQLINDILEFSKGDAGKLEINEEPVDVGETVRECVRMVNEKIKAKAINLVVDISAGIPPMLLDKRKVRQIMLNLLSNAVKFTPPDGSIKVAARLDQLGNMNLIVSDTGVGIAEEDIPIALSVFGQVHRHHSHEGTGLGLPLCKMFAELHGGKLALVSALGEGTTVRIIFPAERCIKNPPATGGADAPPLAPPQSGAQG